MCAICMYCHKDSLNQYTKLMNGNMGRGRVKEKMWVCVCVVCVSVGLGEAHGGWLQTYHFCAFLSFLLLNQAFTWSIILKGQKNLLAYPIIVFLSLFCSTMPMKLNMDFTFNRSLITLKSAALTIVSKY